MWMEVNNTENLIFKKFKKSIYYKAKFQEGSAIIFHNLLCHIIRISVVYKVLPFLNSKYISNSIPLLLPFKQ